MRIHLFASACLLSLLATGVANAQQPSQPTPSPLSPTTPPEVVAPPAGTLGGTGSGVVRPPNMDQGINIKPPESMSVVPPPGAPGGNPNVIPK